MSLLEMQNCNVFYGKAQALHDVSISVGDGEVVSLIGRNGAGKSTLLKAIMGLNPIKSGTRMYEGRDATKISTEMLGRSGIAYVPEDRRIFATLSVDENLRIATVMGRKGAWDLERVYNLFPRLKERMNSRGDTLSGGEQQMLAVGRGLLTNPKLLLLDEPTEGLAPLVVADLVKAMELINAEGVAILLVEQNLKVPLKLAERQYLIDNGHIRWSGKTDELLAEREKIEALISL
ncbi:MAG: ABC transporter ATP-binding protein [Sneathiella sp.]|uniref:ABC transporter ATP-binding protein n=1 Tax=Sneathiella sp. TaxID=1964365 RepID=UPI000C50132B|nr:ABC transporter ATP-binding protein [Sneathiella sp.]MAZ04446.1 ABC transporter ATP-binding protein [Sneathiella sp.]